MATVFLGTFYPLFAEVWSGAKLSVGPQFFDATFVPILVPGIVAMVIGPVLAWRRGKSTAALRRLVPGRRRRAVLPRSSSSPFDRAAPPAALAGLALAVWAMLGVLTDLADRAGAAKQPWAHPGGGCAICRAGLGLRNRPFRGRRADRRGYRVDRMAQRADRDIASRRHRRDCRPHPALVGVTEGTSPTTTLNALRSSSSGPAAQQ